MFRLMCCMLCAGSVWAAPGTISPQGELKARIDMTRQRMSQGDVPRFSQDFVLADVKLDPAYPRRFSEYSGDLSGRVIGALACMPGEEGWASLDALVSAALPHQRADGRFGDADLRYTSEEIEKNHMALLWGNGRLLVGLLEYYAARPRPEVLESAQRLGDFLCGVRAGCASPEVAARVKDLGAAGMICFSQLIEGLVMLHGATGDARYLDEAVAIVPWLPAERGHQHSHGYLSTLRGVMMLYEATGDAQWLDFVRNLYDALAASEDLQLYGGVQEYFGSKCTRDEGCSEADFLRLALQLWRATGESRYLDQAEHCLYNQFYANQFATGDFGHHDYFYRGVAPFEGVGRAWWCCTMHGLRAFRDVLDAAVTGDGALRVNLYLDLDWKDGDRAFRMRRQGKGYAISVLQAPEAGLDLAFRVPPWGRIQSARPIEEKDGWVRFETPLRSGQDAVLEFEYLPRIRVNSGEMIPPAQLTDSPVDGVLFYGPWIVGVDETLDPLFYGEPWMENVLYLPSKPEVRPSGGGALAIPQAHISCMYQHGGFPDIQSVTLRPISERSMHEQSTFAVRLPYRKMP